jgi:hypothetical protein
MLFHKCYKVVVKELMENFSGKLVACVMAKYSEGNMALLFSVSFLKSTFVLYNSSCVNI